MKFSENSIPSNKKFGIPFNLGPIKSRQEKIKMRLGNNWYSDTILYFKKLKVYLSFVKNIYLITIYNNLI